MNKRRRSKDSSQREGRPNETLCVLPWIGREVRADGTIGVCCTSDFYISNSDNQPINLTNLSNKVVIDNNASLQSFQKNFLENKKIKDCERCWYEEASGAKSRRQKMNLRHREQFERISNNSLSNSPILVLDIKVGNICNQKCLICGPSASSLWIAEHKAVLGPTEVGIVRNISSASLPVLQTFLNDAVELHIAGGEPFLDERELIQLLEPSVKSGRSKLQTIIIPTNGSFFPERLVKEIFPYFKEVQILLSADGVEEQFEYTRYPAKWNKFYETYRRFKATPFFAGISITLNALNAYNLGDYLQFWESKEEHRIWVGYLNTPDYLSVACLPKEVRDQISRKWLNIKYKTPQMANLIMELFHYLQQFPEIEHNKKFHFLTQLIDKHDSYRRVKFEQYFQDYHVLLRSLLSE